MGRKIIALGHKARQGKDTVGEYLKTKHNFYIYHFAQPLRDEVENVKRKGIPLLSVVPTPGSGCYVGNETFPANHPITQATYAFFKACVDDKNCKIVRRAGATYGIFDLYDVSPAMYKKLLQFWGTDFRRSQDPNYWVKATADHIEQLDEDQDIALCDLRFPNEMSYVKEIGGVTVKINRTLPDGTSYDKLDDGDARNQNHASEHALDGADFDYYLDNPDGDLPRLYENVERMLKAIEAGEPIDIYDAEHM